VARSNFLGGVLAVALAGCVTFPKSRAELLREQMTQAAADRAELTRYLDGLPACSEVEAAQAMALPAGGVAIDRDVSVRAVLRMGGGACEEVLCLNCGRLDVPFLVSNRSFACNEARPCCNGCGGAWLLFPAEGGDDPVMLLNEEQHLLAWGATDCSLESLRRTVGPLDVIATGHLRPRTANYLESGRLEMAFSRICAVRSPPPVSPGAARPQP
jgi:hypothetical protein